MPIVKYLGPFGADGRNLNKTRVLCECAWCHKTWETSWGKVKYTKNHGNKCKSCSARKRKPLFLSDLLGRESIIGIKHNPRDDSIVCDKTRVVCKCPVCKRGRDTDYRVYKETDPLGICHTCSRYGPPLLPNDVLEEYDGIAAISGNLGVRGDVVSSTKVIAICPLCERHREVNFSTVCNHDNGQVLCRQCSAFKQFGKDRVYPDEISEIVDYDEQTLGSMGQMVAGSIVYRECLVCGNKIGQTWDNFRATMGYCVNCRVVSQSHAPSKPQAEFKKAMINAGISGFESEQWIGRKRVDELNRDLNLVCRFNGSFWHCDPRLYDADYVLPGGKIAKEVWEKDKRYVQELENLGYSVYEVWEYDWNNNPDMIIEELKQWIKENS